MRKPVTPSLANTSMATSIQRSGSSCVRAVLARARVLVEADLSGDLTGIFSIRYRMLFHTIQYGHCAGCAKRCQTCCSANVDDSQAHRPKPDETLGIYRVLPQSGKRCRRQILPEAEKLPQSIKNNLVFSKKDHKTSIS